MDQYTKNQIIMSFLRAVVSGTATTRVFCTHFCSEHFYFEWCIPPPLCLSFVVHVGNRNSNCGHNGFSPNHCGYIVFGKMPISNTLAVHLEHSDRHLAFLLQFSSIIFEAFNLKFAVQLHCSLLFFILHAHTHQEQFQHMVNSNSAHSRFTQVPLNWLKFRIG